jgi:hypothetical protein
MKDKYERLEDVAVVENSTVSASAQRALVMGADYVSVVTQVHL